MNVSGPLGRCDNPGVHAPVPEHIGKVIGPLCLVSGPSPGCFFLGECALLLPQSLLLHQGSPQKQELETSREPTPGRGPSEQEGRAGSTEEEERQGRVRDERLSSLAGPRLCPQCQQARVWLSPEPSAVLNLSKAEDIWSTAWEEGGMSRWARVS